MKVSTEQRADRQAVVQIEVESAELEQALERAYRRVVRQVNINGFRPGKAPRRIVEQRLGRGILIEEAARDLVPKFTSDVIQEQNLDAIAEPSVEITSLEPLAFTATIPLRPTVEVGDYTAIRLAPKEVNVTEEQVDEVIERLREQQASWIPLDEPRPATAGDQVTIDLASSLDGESLDSPQTDVTVVLGEQTTLLPEIAQAIQGLSAGESTQVSVPFPEDHPNEQVAGKAPVFEITVKEIKARQLPPVDDEFVTKVSDATSLAELRERIRANLAVQAESQARQQMAQAVIDLVTDQATIEMPPVLVDNQVEQQLAERRQRFERQGLRWDNVLRILNQTEEELREELRPEAERRVRNSLALLEVARREEIAVTPEEIDAEIERLVDSYEEEAKPRMRLAFNRETSRDTIQNSLFESKIIDRLVEIATEGRGYTVRPGELETPPGLSEALAPAAEAEAPSSAEAAAPTETAESAEDETSAPSSEQTTPVAER